MSQRFFSIQPLDQPQATLDGPEAHHLLHVMRLAVGDEVILFDGSGVECLARIEQLGRSEVQLAVLSRETVDRELPFSLTLAVALPKGDRQKWLVEKAVELGVTRLVPLVTERGVARPVGKALDRLRRSVVEASKQCERNRLMEIAEPADAADLLATVSADTAGLIAHPGTVDTSATLTDITTQLSRDRGVVVAVGPEGGFTDEEVAQAISAGWQTLELGTRILRVETAALAIAAQLAGLAKR